MIEETKQEITPLMFDTYFAAIKNSIGSNIFRNFYAEVGGHREDIMQNGHLSCAFFASSILTLFKQIKGGHGTVNSTIKDLLESGWEVVQEPKVGCVLIWEGVVSNDGSVHKHIGFYMSDDRAISNSSELGHPIEHHVTYEGKRNIETILWNPKFK